MDHPTFGVANSDAHNTYNIVGRDFTGESRCDEGDLEILRLSFKISFMVSGYRKFFEIRKSV
jgi:hypothetical protein